MHPFVADIYNILRDTLVPSRCVICTKEYPTALCTNCQSLLSPAQNQCGACDKPSLLGLTHPHCRRAQIPLQEFSLYDYQNAHLARSIIMGKYHLVADVFRVYGALLGTACTTSLVRPARECILCPIPLHRRRHAWRGFNQSELLAAGIASAIGVPLVPLLQRTRYTSPQKNLRASARAHNVADCFALDPAHAQKIHGAHIILVDDVYTTGHTLAAAAQILFQAGAKHVTYVTLAKE